MGWTPGNKLLIVAVLLLSKHVLRVHNIVYDVLDGISLEWLLLSSICTLYKLLGFEFWLAEAKGAEV